MNNYIKLFNCVLVLLLFLSSQKVNADVQEVGQEKIDETISEFIISTAYGNIALTGWDQDHISVEYTKSAPTEDELKNLKVVVEQEGNSLTVKLIRLRREPAVNGKADFVIFMPRTVKHIRAWSTKGDIILRGMSENVSQKLGTAHGRIDTDMSGNLDISSMFGSIRFVFAGQTLIAHTVNGDIDGTIKLIDDKGLIDIGSTSGDIDLKVRGGTSLLSSSLKGYVLHFDPVKTSF